jgi:hypothetical protein
MKDINGMISYKNKEYKLVFNLNVMESIQNEYGTIDKWTALTDGISGEPDIQAVLYGITEMINEGIEIDNDDKGTNDPLMTKKQVGRMLTEVGLQEVMKTMQKTVVDSTKSEEKNV